MSETGHKPAMKLWLRLVLFASLALNLIVIGLAVGVARHGAPDKRLPHGDPFGGPYLGAMEKDDRRAIIADLRKSGEGRRSRDEVRAEFDQIIAALRATPYRPEQVEAIIRGQFDDIQTRARTGTDAMLERLRTMDDAERAAYAGRLEEALKRGPKGNHDHKGKDRDTDRGNDRGGKTH